MNLTQLEYIVTLAEEKQITSAAEKLFVTPAALSQHISKVEKRLGVPIFERINRKLHLTYCGEIYVEAAKRILQTKKEAFLAIDGIQSQTRDKFIFGCSQKRGLTVFANIFPQFHKKYPNVKVILKEANMNELYTLVIDGTIDIAMVSPIEKHSMIVHEFLDEEEIVLAIPKDHKLAHLANDRAGTLEISDLSLFKDDNWMLSNNTSMHRNLTNDLFEKAGFFPKKILVETSSTDPQVLAVKEGIAVSLVPLSASLQAEDITTLRLSPTPYRKLYAGYRQSYHLSKAQEFFISLIKEHYTNVRV